MGLHLLVCCSDGLPLPILMYLTRPTNTVLFALLVYLLLLELRLLRGTERSWMDIQSFQ